MKITHNNIDLEVDFAYFPEEPMVMYYKDGSGHPGSPAYIEINSVEYNGVDVTDIYEENDLLEEIEEIILENYDTEWEFY